MARKRKKHKSQSLSAPIENTGENNLRLELRRLRISQITPSPAYDPVAIKKEKRDAAFRTLIMVVCICVLLGSMYTIVDTLMGYARSQEVYGNLLDDIYDDNLKTTMLVNENGTTLPFGKRIASSTGSSVDKALYERMKSRLAVLQASNSDIIGWIEIPGTKNINYPLMHYSDNNFYLKHDYLGRSLISGSIFLDYRCSQDFNQNHNTVVYGHNMQNGQMFSELIKFLDKDFFEENKFIHLYTNYGVYTYEIFTIFKTSYDYKYIETGFASHQEFVDFAYEMKENSMFERYGIEFDENSRIITLSTCTNILQSERYCIQALLVDAYND